MLSADLHSWPHLTELARRVGLEALPEGRKVAAAVASLLCNVLFFTLLFRHEVEPGDTRLLANDSAPVMLATPTTQSAAESPGAAASNTPTPPELAIGEPRNSPTPALQQLANTDLPPRIEIEPQDDSPPAAAKADAPPAAESPVPEGTTAPVPPQRTIEIPASQQAMLSQRMLSAVQSLKQEQRSEIAWASDSGQLYSATLTREPAADSMGLENIVANITTTAADGTQLQTQLKVQRLAFSQFTQVVDYWDDRVQLHDDEIVGRFHSNSPFKITTDGEASPKFLGKVTTAATMLMFSTGGSPRRGSMFKGGLETRAGRIDFPQQARPFAATAEPDSYVHSFTEDTHLVFFADGTYTWRGRRATAAEQRHYPADRPAYFIAPKGVTLFVRGTVNGKVLVYSAQGIVIEDDLVYATNPRTSIEVDDYIGLVSDRDVQIAPPSVTGRGDLNIHAAVFARQRFVVSAIESRRTGTLFLYGSLTVGTISATEPRYATKIEFDPRFDRVRPPNFPNTNRYEIVSWRAAWRELKP